MEKPDRVTPKSKIHPITKAMLFGRIFFRWVKEVVQVSAKNPWEQDMHYDMPEKDSVDTYKHKFASSIEKTGDIWATVRDLFKWQLREFYIGALILSAYFFSGTLISEQIVSEMATNPDLHELKELHWFIYMFLGMAFINSSSLIMRRFYLFKAQRLSLVIRACVLWVVQSKTMRFSALNSEYFSEGNITNLLQVDVKRMAEFIAQLFIVIQAGSLVLMGIVFQVYLAGWRLTVVIMGTYVGIYMIYLFLYYFRSKYAKELMYFKDKRMSFFRNVLNNVEYIKIRAMENFFCVKMFEYREEEIAQLRKSVYVMSWESLLEWTAKTMSTFVLLVFFRFLRPEEEITTGTYFAFYQIFNSMKEPIYYFTNNINFLVEINVSIKRFNEFLTATEVGKDRFKDLGHNSDVAIRVTHGDFVWKIDETELFQKRNKREEKLKKRNEKKQKKDSENLKKLEEKLVPQEGYDELFAKDDFLSAQVDSTSGAGQEQDLDEFELRNVNLEIKKGEKIIVFGESSQGKSSLLYCMLGEMIAKHQNATVQRSGKVAFLAQARWLIGDSIRENITLGKEFDAEWMDECLKASCLVQDLSSLNNGMDTMLGDTSDTVSGGQRARIALARCFYHK
jgi:ABC-type multidrug transport system fused ATPase/permease subunit